MLSNSLSRIEQGTSSHSQISALVALPPEVQAIIAKKIRRRTDLNSLCRTCKILRWTISPQLYETLVFYVGQKSKGLRSIEKLISSSGDFLNFTTTLKICAYQKSLWQIKGHWNNEDKLLPYMRESSSSESEDNTALMYRPKRQPSKALNILVRLILMRLPKYRLQHFSWKHRCSIEMKTLEVLFANQEGALKILRFNEREETYEHALYKNIVQIDAGCLDDESYPQDCWPLLLAANNAPCLRHLRLGYETEVAMNNPFDSPREGIRRSLCFKESAFRRSEAETVPFPMQSLRNLTLIGVSPNCLIKGIPFPVIDFAVLSSLSLESCDGLEEALSVLTTRNTSLQSPEWVPNLKIFHIRHEYSTTLLGAHLVVFLCSFTGLEHLFVLLEGPMDYPPTETMTNILNAHGQTLRALIWDTRRLRRCSLAFDGYLHAGESYNSLYASESDNSPRILAIVSQRCPNLVELGWTLDWTSIIKEGYHSPIMSCMKRLGHLKTLNIRNLPCYKSNNTASAPLRVDEIAGARALHFVQDLIRYSQPDNSPLKVIALGALTYRDVLFGSRHVSFDDLDVLLRLRVYYIDYSKDFMGATVPFLSLIAEGSDPHIDAFTEHSQILKPYWLK